MSGPSAEILTIGTEILLGEIVDTNSAYIAQALRQAGVNLYATATVGDNVDRIRRALSNSLDRADVVITTGGLGPTVDDMTREAVAGAAGVELVFREELWQQVKDRFARYGREPGDNNRRQAHIPDGATGIENPIGTAPAFSLALEDRLIYALPGVPAEMKWLLHERVIPDLEGRFQLSQVIRRRVLRTAGVGESTLDEKIRDLEESENPTLGLSAHPGRVDLRLTASAESEDEAEALLDDMEAELRRRVGKHILGSDADTLETVVLNLLRQRNWQMVTIEAGTGGALAGSLSDYRVHFKRGVLLGDEEAASAQDVMEEEMERHEAEVGLSLVISRQAEEIMITGCIRTPEFERDFEQAYGGPPENAPGWGAALLLERLRRRLA